LTEFSAFRLVLDISGKKERKKESGVIVMCDTVGDKEMWYFEDDQAIRSELVFLLDVKGKSMIKLLHCHFFQETR